MAAPHAAQSGRVIAGTILRCGSVSIQTDGGEQRRGGSGGDGRDGDPVDKIAPRDRPAHAEAAEPIAVVLDARHLIKLHFGATARRSLASCTPYCFCSE